MTAAPAIGGKKAKKTDRQEEQLRTMSQKLAKLQFKSSFAVMFVMIGFFSLLGSLCVLARLVV